MNAYLPQPRAYHPFIRWARRYPWVHAVVSCPLYLAMLVMITWGLRDSALTVSRGELMGRLPYVSCRIVACVMLDPIRVWRALRRQLAAARGTR